MNVAPHPHFKLNVEPKDICIKLSENVLLIKLQLLKYQIPNIFFTPASCLAKYLFLSFQEIGKIIHDHSLVFIEVFKYMNISYN